MLELSVRKLLVCAVFTAVHVLIPATQANAGWWWHHPAAYHAGWYAYPAYRVMVHRPVVYASPGFFAPSAVVQTYAGCHGCGHRHLGAGCGCGTSYGVGVDHGCLGGCHGCASVSDCGSVDPCGSAAYGFSLDPRCGGSTVSSSSMDPIVTDSGTVLKPESGAAESAPPSLPTPPPPAPLDGDPTPPPPAPLAPDAPVDLNVLPPSQPSDASHSLPGDSLLLVVAVPQQARVLINGKLTTTEGEQRRYISRGLASGNRYIYAVEAELEVDGTTVRERKVVDAQAGDIHTLRFDFAAPQVASR